MTHKLNSNSREAIRKCKLSFEEEKKVTIIKGLFKLRENEFPPVKPV